MNNRKILALVLAAAMMLSLLAGCASGNTTETTAAPTTAAATEADEVPAEATVAPVENSHYPVTITTYNYAKQ